jgi:hypothetical protein
MSILPFIMAMHHCAADSIPLAESDDRNELENEALEGRAANANGKEPHN